MRLMLMLNDKLCAEENEFCDILLSFFDNNSM